MKTTMETLAKIADMARSMMKTRGYRYRYDKGGDRDTLMSIYKKAKNDDQETDCLVYITNHKADAQLVRSFVAYMERNNTKLGVLIVPIKPSAQTAKRLAEDNLQLHRSFSLNIQTFTFSDMLYNPLESDWLPQYSILTQDEKVAFLKNGNYDFQSLPQISISDPVAKYLGAIRGDILCEAQDNMLADGIVTRSLYWRRCVRAKEDSKISAAGK
jgi:DNA-directed RNA polymerase subunit H (RpoH/RPB5)